MTGSGYRWRRLTTAQREELLHWRQRRLHPWHSPPHWKSNFGNRHFHLTAACWDHEPRIGKSLNRMEAFATSLIATLAARCDTVPAWCVLPNHYHVLVTTGDLPGVLAALGKLHGRTSHAWNGEDNARGRNNFYRCVDGAMRSDAHQWCTLNYIHHNPVHHGYVRRWTDWPFTSAHLWLEHHGRTESERLWRAYPVLDYGKGWDDPEL
jgi:putative transposase